ncbi:MAG: hypothetical protein R3F54_22820 [Alphaproteobacteria bacterium]
MLVLGTLLIAPAILAFLEIGTFFNRADAPSWTRRGWVGETTAILFVFMIGLGTACVIGGLVDAGQDGIGAVDASLAFALVVLAVFFGHWRRRGRRAAAKASASARLVDVAAVHSALADQPTPPRDQPPAGRSMRPAA